jgi:hypothetical protein
MLERGYGLFWDVQPIHSAANFRGQTRPFFWNGLTSNVLGLPAGHSLDTAAFGLEPVNNIHDHRFTTMLTELTERHRASGG